MSLTEFVFIEFAMKSIYYFHTNEGFQTTLTDLRNRFDVIKSSHPNVLKLVDITNTRIAATALYIAHTSNPMVLANIIKSNPLPGRKFRDEIEHKNVYSKTLHVTPLINDYIKRGSSNMNIEILGELEDALLKEDPKAERIRITDRQYLHLAIYHLSSLSNRNLLSAISASSQLHPFLKIGLHSDRVLGENLSKKIPKKKT